MASFKEKLEANKGKHSYVEGVTAAQDGKSLNTNPYKVGSSSYMEWSDGYLDAVFLGGM